MDILEQISHTSVDTEYRPKAPITIKAVGEVGGHSSPSSAAPVTAADGTVLSAKARVARTSPVLVNEAGPLLLNGPLGANVTRVVYFDLEQGGVDLGRVVFGL